MDKKQKLEQILNNYTPETFLLTIQKIELLTHEELGLLQIELNHAKTLLKTCEYVIEARNKQLKQRDSDIQEVISLLIQTTEFEVLDSFKLKVAELQKAAELQKVITWKK